MSSPSAVELVDVKINEIRRNAGNPMVQCPTCCRAASLPYRRHDEGGRIVEGCIDAFHGPSLVPTTSSYEWHMKPVAKALRLAELNQLKRMN